MNDVVKLTVESRALEVITSYAGQYQALDVPMRVLAVFGALPIGIAAVILACCAADPRKRKGGWIAIMGALAAIAMIWWLEQVMVRPRPFLMHPIRLLICPPDGTCSPSYEMSVAAALGFGLLAYSRLRWMIIPYLLLIGTARVFCGTEYPLDQVWAIVAGGLAVSAAALIFDWNYITRNWQGRSLLVSGFILASVVGLLLLHTPLDASLLEMSSYTQKSPRENAVENGSVIKGWSPAAEKRIAHALLRHQLPGRIMKVEVGSGRFIKVAAVKFLAGPDGKPMPLPLLQREALHIVITTLKTVPELSEVDVWGVTTYTNEAGKPALRVIYSVTAQRKDAVPLLGQSPTKLTPPQALSRFGLICYRPEPWRRQP